MTLPSSCHRTSQLGLATLMDGQSSISPPPPYTNRRSRRHTANPEQLQRPQTEHDFSLTDSKKNVWAVLTLKSHARSSNSLPYFSAPEEIAGTLEFDARKTDCPNGITIMVTGSLDTGLGSKDIKFLELTRNVWSKASGSKYNDNLPSQSPGIGKSKLQGVCTWPFSIPLPSEVVVKGKIYQLPETFAERHIPAGVNYQVVVRFSRGALRSDQRITTNIAYVPYNISPRPSPLRLIAYQSCTKVPGPYDDPDGWLVHPLRECHTIVDRETISIQSVFHLSSPAVYARGSTIHIYLLLTTPSTNLLWKLREQCRPQVVLRRTVRYYINPSAAQPYSVGWVDSVDEYGAVSWTMDMDNRGNMSDIGIQGEVSLERDLTPTCELDKFSVNYHLILKPILPIAPSPETMAEPLFEYPVQITAHQPREIPRHNPPSYTDYEALGSDSRPSSIQSASLASSRADIRATQIQRRLSRWGV